MTRLRGTEGPSRTGAVQRRLAPTARPGRTVVTLRTQNLRPWIRARASVVTRVTGPSRAPAHVAAGVQRPRPDRWAEARGPGVGGGSRTRPVRGATDRRAVPPSRHQPLPRGPQANLGCGVASCPEAGGCRLTSQGRHVHAPGTRSDHGSSLSCSLVCSCPPCLMSCGNESSTYGLGRPRNKTPTTCNAWV